MQVRVPATWVRGGTSRAILFLESEVRNYDRQTLERIALAAVGSPDSHGRQIDGLGSGISSSSKMAIVGRCFDGLSDVAFRFGQVNVQCPSVDWTGTCGNISSAIGPFAIDKGLVDAEEPFTKVRILATNTGKRFNAYVPVRGGYAEVEGDYVIDGVPAPGARIDLEYLEPGGSLGNGVLPTGEPRQDISLSDGTQVSISIVDAALPMVYVKASDIGADATLLATKLDADFSLQTRLEEIRCHGAVLLGLAENLGEAHAIAKTVPKVAMVAPPESYETSSGVAISMESIDLLARAISMGNTHRTFPATSSICTAVAAAVVGSTVHDVSRAPTTERLRIGHPAGRFEARTKTLLRGGKWVAESATISRTSRRIMEGNVLVPQSYMAGNPEWFVE